MRSRSLEGFRRLLSSAFQRDRELLLLLAPNYEPRSVLGLRSLLSSLEAMKDIVSLELWTLQARQNRVEPLEYLKTANVATVNGHLKSLGWLRLSTRTIPYPEVTENQINSYLITATDSLAGYKSLMIDISTLPRRLIVALLKSASGLLRATKIDSLFLLYGWAENYPWTPYASEEGALKVVETDQVLGESVVNRTGIHAAILCGRQGFDSKLLLETLPPGSNAQVYMLINRFDLYAAFQMMRSNSTVITSGAQKVNYYLSMSSAHEMLMDRARYYTPARDELFLIAPFGPKPLVVTTFLALEQVRARASTLPNFLAGTIGLSGHQYNTTYSLGFSHWEVLEIESSDLP